ncbi:hypothetical protein EJ05DRAFT_473971 [Pseudovirgaria hyperparasitica]|uniref:Uncharacterized protein n=1 Tax=Pseudovirgaria hyperparasitica TaxID=470096 RepID=A0A6A6WHB5_9PEZI|nr:uncharacterized protein EJ05DRAFT_473971 [Pseudovirgaria hyperparasitica]KAF2761474.1 hypothetical protein EJ05DRAFT_473971 [Pseudovirgaria hyperparasitica]
MPPSPVLQQLQTHLQQLQTDPSTKLDIKLLQQCEIYVASVSPTEEELQLWKSLFFQAIQLLSSFQQDPSSFSSLIMKLSAPLEFDHIKMLDLALAMDLSAGPFHLMVLGLLEKATAPAHVELLAGMPELLSALVKLWLCAEDTSVALKSSNLLLNFLRLSKNPPGSKIADAPLTAYGQGPVWKRIFGDRDVFRLFFSICSSRENVPREIDLTKHQRTVAQARLMDWLPQVGVLDWDTLLRCHHVDVVTDYGLETGDGLLKFVAEDMVNYEDDILMHISLIDFYTTLISTVTRRTTADLSVSLQYLISRRLHHRAMSYWMDPNPDDHLQGIYLTGPSASYISLYASTYPEHFEVSMLSEIHARLHQRLDVGPGVWIRSSPVNELRILSSLPRTSIFPSHPGAFMTESALALVPTLQTNPDALNALATIFHGPTEPRPAVTDMIMSSDRWDIEAEAAAGLFWLYYSTHPSLFKDLVRHADIAALPQTAFAAINLLRAIITATWTRTTPDATSASSVTVTASSSAAAQAHVRVVTFTAANRDKPESGLETLLLLQNWQVVAPYLFKNKPVGHVMDEESTVYKLSVARHGLIVAIKDQLELLMKEHGHNPEWDSLHTILLQKLTAGPREEWGPGVGEKLIATIGH